MKKIFFEIFSISFLLTQPIFATQTVFEKVGHARIILADPFNIQTQTDVDFGTVFVKGAGQIKIDSETGKIECSHFKTGSCPKAGTVASVKIDAPPETNVHIQIEPAILTNEKGDSILFSPQYQPLIKTNIAGQAIINIGGILEIGNQISAGEYSTTFSEKGAQPFVIKFSY